MAMTFPRGAASRANQHIIRSMNGQKRAAAKRHDHGSRDRACVAVFRQITIDACAEPIDNCLESWRELRIVTSRTA